MRKEEDLKEKIYEGIMKIMEEIGGRDEIMIGIVKGK